MLELENVTLICIDCFNYESAIKALNQSTKDIKFKEVLFLTNKLFYAENFKTIIIDPIKSTQDYSKFIITKLVDYVKTDFVLIIQHDGYIINPKLWQDEFLNYDYIGAAWWYNEMNVGNGGFSLRSKKLLNALKKLDIKRFHPEDDIICRQFRKRLEYYHKIKFAPVDIAEQFSYEGNQKHPFFLNNTFGFHGIINRIF